MYKKCIPHVQSSKKHVYIIIYAETNRHHVESLYLAFRQMIDVWYCGIHVPLSTNTIHLPKVYLEIHAGTIVNTILMNPKKTPIRISYHCWITIFHKPEKRPFKWFPGSRRLYYLGREVVRIHLDDWPLLYLLLRVLAIYRYNIPFSINSPLFIIF